MPATDDDEALITFMPPGTRVEHRKYGPGTVTAKPVEYTQVPVHFDDAAEYSTMYCYPSNLMVLIAMSREQWEKVDELADSRRSPYMDVDDE